MTVPGIRSFAAIVAWMRYGCKAMVGLTVTQEVGFRWDLIEKIIQGA